MTTVTDLPVSSLTPHPKNVRRNLGDLTELAASIKGVGLLQPLTVAPDGDQYVVIAGHRRLAAAVKAGLPAVPCIIRADLVKPVDQLNAMLVENLQRSDLTVIEEATAYEQLALLGVKPPAIAKATGRSRATVDSRLRLMTLPEQHRDRVADGQLSLADAELLAKIADDPEALAYVGQSTGPNLRWKVEGWPGEKARRVEAAKVKAAAKSKAKTGAPSPEDDWKAQRAAEEAKRQARLEASRTADQVRVGWVREQIALGSEEFWDGAARIALDRALDYGSESQDQILAFLGVTVSDEGDYSLEGITTDQVIRAVILSASEVLDPSHGWRGITKATGRLQVFCGYQPSDAELALMAPST